MEEEYQLQDGGVQQAEQVVEAAEPEYQEREVYELSLPLETEEDQGEDQVQNNTQNIEEQEEEVVGEDQEMVNEDDDELELEQHEEDDYDMDAGYAQNDDNTINNDQPNNQNQDANNNAIDSTANNGKFRKNSQGGQQGGHYWPKHKFAVISECVEFLRSKGGSVDGKTFNHFFNSLKVQNLVKKRLRKVIQASGGEIVWDQKQDTISLWKGSKKNQQAKQLQQQQQAKKKGNAEKGGKGFKEDEDYNWYAINKMVLDYLGSGGLKSVGEVLDYMYRNVKNPGKIDLYKFLKSNRNIEVTKHYVQFSEKYRIAESRKRKRGKDSEIMRSKDRYDRRRQSSPPPRSFKQKDHPSSQSRHPYHQEDHIYHTNEQQEQHPYRQFGGFPQAQQIQPMESLMQMQQLRPQMGTQVMAGQMNNQFELQAQGGGVEFGGGMDQSQYQFVIDQGQQRQPMQPVLQGNMDVVPAAGMYGGQVMNPTPANIQGQIIQLPNGDMYILKGNQDNNVNYTING